MNSQPRILRALLCGAWASGLANFLGELAALNPIISSGQPREFGLYESQWLIRAVATLCGLITGGLVFWQREKWGTRTQSAILGAAGAAFLLLTGSLALELVWGPGSVQFVSPWGGPLTLWPIGRAPAFSVQDWAVCSIPAALILGAVAGVVLANSRASTGHFSRADEGLTGSVAASR